MRVLQAALQHAIFEMKHIPLDIITEIVLPGAKDLKTSELVSRPLFIWYDYFSMPQLEKSSLGSAKVSKNSSGSQSDLSKAIESIPAYVAACAFFFVLCPVVESTAPVSKVFSPTTWAERGWCRLERTCCELGNNQSWIVIKGPASLELISCPTASMGSGPVGEGQFAVAEDRAKLAPMLLPLVERKLLRLLRAQDLVSYRVVLNQQSLYLRGLNMGDFCKPVPGFEDQGGPVEEFLYQNGFTTISERDSGGWLPLHYAALGGNSTLIEGLLAKRANPNRKTKRDQPLLGLPPLTSALAIAVFCKHYDATRLLISAKASLSGNLLCTPLVAACLANSPLGLRTLCEARCNPWQRNLVGNSPFETACSQGSVEAMEELYLQRGGLGIDMTNALHNAMCNLVLPKMCF